MTVLVDVRVEVAVDAVQVELGLSTAARKKSVNFILFLVATPTAATTFGRHLNIEFFWVSFYLLPHVVMFVVRSTSFPTLRREIQLN